MKTIYNVIHYYDVDGGFGDAISQEEVLFTTLNKEVAEKFVHKYSNKHIYDTPYANLYIGELAIREMPVIDKYEDIKQDIIDWGESNIKETDYHPEDFCSYPENDLDSIVKLENLQNK